MRKICSPDVINTAATACQAAEMARLGPGRESMLVITGRALIGDDGVATTTMAKATSATRCNCVQDKEQTKISFQKELITLKAIEYICDKSTMEKKC